MAMETVVSDNIESGEEGKVFDVRCGGS